MPEELREIREAETMAAATIAQRVIHLTAKERAAVLLDPEADGLLEAFAKIWNEGICACDAARIEAVLCRATGPLPKSIELTGKDGQAVRGELTLTIRDYTSGARKP